MHIEHWTMTLKLFFFRITEVKYSGHFLDIAGDDSRGLVILKYLLNTYYKYNILKA